MSHRNRHKLNALAIERVAASGVKYLAPKRASSAIECPDTLWGVGSPLRIARVCASANLVRSKATNADPWVIGLRRRRPSLVVAMTLGNKTARIAWAVMHRQENYQRMATAA